jgi:hypothetical protein
MGKRQSLAYVTKLSDVPCYYLALPPAFSFIFHCFDFKELWDPQSSPCLGIASFLGDPCLWAYILV